MEYLNYAFFEEYKRLDKLCGDLYGEQYGISCYIEDMKASTSNNDYRNIPSWTSDLKKLVRFRHTRNQLAHTEGAFHENNCTQEDVAWIQNFYGRILSGNDSLALLHRYSEEKRVAAENRKTEYGIKQDAINAHQEKMTVEENDGWKAFHWIIFFLIIIGAFGLIAAVQYYFLLFYT